MKKPLVLYHARCPDGFGGAWAAWKKFGDRAEYRPLEHNQKPPSDIAQRKVFFIDYCYSREIMEQLYTVNKHITVIDHHISQKDAIEQAIDHVFDVTHSGCVLAWKYFHPTKKIPRLLLTLEDMDIYTLKLPGTKEYCEAFFVLDLYSFSFKKWNTLVQNFERADKRKRYRLLGEKLLVYKDIKVTQLLSFAQLVEFEGYKVSVVNTPVFYSEVANALCEKFKIPFGITWYYRNGRIHVSLRSQGNVDVSVLAVKYGSGGHKGAAGFSYSADKPFPWRIIEK